MAEPAVAFGFFATNGADLVLAVVVVHERIIAEAGRPALRVPCTVLRTYWRTAPHRSNSCTLNGNACEAPVQGTQ
jgi:hypothetical protein